MDMSKIIDKLFPVLIIVVSWLLAQISDLQHQVTVLNSKISLVVTSDNNQAVNTGAELAREKLRIDLEREIQKNRDDIAVNRQNILILEERIKKGK